MDSNLSQVQTLFAELTRYPLEILDPHADLEEDLGIDSVKQMEILSTFKDRFGLPEDLQVDPESMRTIADVVTLLDGASPAITNGASSSEVPPSVRLAPASSPRKQGEREQATNGASSSEVPPSVRLAPASSPRKQGERELATNGASSSKVPPSVRLAPASSPRKQGERELATHVIDTLEKVTRYPREILTLDADLEEDLGIDSVKMAEALSVLGEELGLPQDARPPGDDIRTIGDVVSALRALLPPSQISAPSAPEPTPALEARSVNGTAVTNGVKPGLTPFLLGGDKPFAGKVALITGSGHGIGRAIAEEVANLGAHVIINSFHSRDKGEATKDAILKSGGKASHIWGSVANLGQLNRIFDEIEAEHGCLDFFISNASNGMLGPLETIQPEHWDRAFRTNIVGLHQGALRAAKLMAPKGGGKIVTLSSPGAQRYIEHFGCMGPIKAAVESLTRYLAIELAPQNIQVNSVSAGPIYGALLDKYPEAERLVPYWESLSAGQRLGQAQDVSNFVAYLLSPASNKISGSVLLVDNAGSQRI